MNNLLKKLFWVVIIFSVIMIFFRLGRADTLTDGSHYSFRALGYIDYLGSDAQSTPVQWFKTEIPSWSKLSFHDAPPLVFLIQHIFFRIFGENLLAARVPFALAGLGTVILIYLIIQKLYDKRTGILSAFILACSTYFIWSSRITFLEGIETFFIVLTCWFLIKASENDKYFWHFGVSLGLTFLTKYTSFFLLPLAVLYLFLKNKSLLYNKKFLLSLAVALAIFSPVIFYNYKMYQARGHFDVQFSALFRSQMYEAAKQDWSGLFYDNVPKTNIFLNFKNAWLGLRAGYSLPFYILVVLSSLYSIAYGWLRRQNNKNFFIPLALGCITLIFMFIPAGPRYLPIFVPFLAMAVSIFIINFYNRTVAIAKKPALALAVIVCVFIPVMGYEFYYNINTNHRYQPIGKTGKNYSELREENYGYNNLINYLEPYIKSQDYYKIQKRFDTIQDFSSDPNDLRDRDAFIYDSNMSWFATFWYFDRLAIYHNIIFLPDAAVASSLGSDVNWFNFFQGRGVKNLFYIKTVDKNALDPGRREEARLTLSNSLEKIFTESAEKSKMGEVIEIKNPRGEIAFRVFKFKLK